MSFGLRDSRRGTACGREAADRPERPQTRREGTPLGELMSKITRGVLAFLALCGLSFLLLNCGSTVNRSSGLLYVLIEGSNVVSSYAVDLTSGNLSLINSNASTCKATTCGLPENIILDPTGATALVANQGVYTAANPNLGISEAGVVPTMYGYTVNSDGSLALKGDLSTTGSTNAAACDPPFSALTPAASQGFFWRCDLIVATTRDASGKFLFVITGGNQGVSTPAPNPDPLGSPNLPPLLYVFATQPGSTTLTLTGNNCPGTSTPCPFPLTRVPSAITAINDPNSSNILLYITSTRDLVVGENDDSTLSEYSVDGSGNVTEHPYLIDPTTHRLLPYTTAASPSTVLAVQTAPIGGTSGLFVYVGSATSNSVSVFQLCTVQNATCQAQDVSNFKLLPVGAAATVGSNPVGMVVDPTKTFLYVISENSSQVFGFRINATQGTLTALSPANLNTGNQPVAIAMHSSGLFLFVSNNGSSNVSSYLLNTTSGAMSSPLTVTSLSNPAGLVTK